MAGGHETSACPDRLAHRLVDPPEHCMPAGPLRGSLVPLVTPFDKNLKVDYDTYASLVDRQVAGGSHGVVVTGTSGEPASLTVSERAQLVRVAVQASAGRLPIVAATGSESLAAPLDPTRHAQAAGARAP